MAYPQSSIKHNQYMNLPKLINKRQVNSKTCILKSVINIYVQKQTGRVWNNILLARYLPLDFVNNTLTNAYSSKDVPSLSAMRTAAFVLVLAGNKIIKIYRKS